LAKRTVKGTTCFFEHRKHRVPCEKNDCPQWHADPSCQNCILISAADGPKTLQQIGDMFDVTRMRICQVEKMIFRKLQADARVADSPR
jgi:hypothetical protein